MFKTYRTALLVVDGDGPIIMAADDAAMPTAGPAVNRLVKRINKSTIGRIYVTVIPEEERRSVQAG